jgi:hypothetical protein
MLQISLAWRLCWIIFKSLKNRSFILKRSKNVEQRKAIRDFDKGIHLNFIVINGSKILHEVKEASRRAAQYNLTTIKTIEYIKNRVK